MSDIARNLANVQERMANAALRAGRAPSTVTLIAIAKTFPAEAIVAAYEAGVRHFGENRVKEGAAKIPAVMSAISGPHPTWHMVGHIQSRKAQDVVSTFGYVHSVSRLKIARRLSRFAEEARTTLPALLQCNVSGEETKYGFDLYRWERNKEQRDAFFITVEEILALPGLAVHGLMTMAPLVDDPETVRPVFASLRGLLDALGERFPSGDWRHLSMGMTDDFQVAIEEGATMIRVGRAIFGPRS